MKALIFSIIYVFLGFQTCLAADAEKIEFGQSFKIQSEVMGQEREVNVWLPKGYGKKDKRYPVVYLLDGGVDQDFFHIAALHQLAELNWAHGTAIVVGIRTQQRISELTSVPLDNRFNSFEPKPGGAQKFRTYLEQEVIPFIEGRFDVEKHRVIIGESLAGLFVVDSLLNQPDLFDDYIAISPSLWWDDRRLGILAEQLLARTDYEEKRVYLTIADEGGTMQTGLNLVLDALGSAKSGPDWTYVDRSQTYDHSTIYHPAALDAFKWLFPIPPYVADKTPWYLIEGGQPAEGD